MKQISLFIICLLFTQILAAQKVILEKGEELTFKETTFIQNDYNKVGMDFSKMESLARQEVKLKVTDVTATYYLIETKVKELDEYLRIKKMGSKNWQTRTFLYNEFKSDSSDIKYRNYQRINWYDIKPIRFKLSHKGEAYDVVLPDTLKSLYNGPQDSILRTSICTRMGKYFSLIAKEINIGDKIASLGTIVKADSSLVVVKNKDQNKNEHWDYTYTIDRKSGVIKELVNSQIITKKTKEGIEKSNIVTRSVLITNSTKAFACKFSRNDVVKDTLLEETNVRLRGKIINAQPNEKVCLGRSYYIVDTYMRDRIEVDLKKDNSFEIRLKLDEITEFEFTHKEKANFYLQPGDDLFLTVDMNQFDESIRCTGIGSSSVNYCFERFLFNEKSKTSLRNINDRRVDYPQLTPEEYKAKSLAMLTQGHEFLNKFKSQIAPEVYLADYYQYKMKIVDNLRDYPIIQRMYRKKANLKVHIIKPDFYNYTELTHPDNALMAFCPDYDRLIRAYVFFFLTNRMKGQTGRGNSISVNNYYDHQHISNYNTAHTYFSGMAQHVLKYETVKDAFRDVENTKWTTFVSLYERFIKEYPNAKRTQLIKEAYQKAKQVALGALAYDFELEDLDGNSVNLSDFKGKAVFINFWTSSCAACRYAIENYSIEQYKKLKGEKIEYLFIALEKDIDKVKTYWKENNGHGIKLIAKEKEKILKQKFLIDETPHYVLIDINGRIVKNKIRDPRELIQKPELLLQALNPQLTAAQSARKISKLKLSISVVLGMLVLAFLGWWLNRKSASRRLKLAALNTKVKELELTAIRAQMNPHFMYNCLNSIQNLVQKKEADKAHNYLSKFASLIRQVLKHSDKNEVSLHEELEMINNYLELEKLRFDINYSVDVADNVDCYSIFVPPLLLQPIVENAILHGLVPKNSDRQLKIAVSLISQNICITIEDNGIGRKASNSLKKNGNGKGLDFCRERLELLSTKDDLMYQLEIVDLTDDKGIAQGTRVSICYNDEV